VKEMPNSSPDAQKVLKITNSTPDAAKVEANTNSTPDAPRIAAGLGGLRPPVCSGSGGAQPSHDVGGMVGAAPQNFTSMVQVYY
jgi:hypothetical protein